MSRYFIEEVVPLWDQGQYLQLVRKLFDKWKSIC